MRQDRGDIVKGIVEVRAFNLLELFQLRREKKRVQRVEDRMELSLVPAHHNGDPAHSKDVCKDGLHRDRRVGVRRTVERDA